MTNSAATKILCAAALLGLPAVKAEGGTRYWDGGGSNSYWNTVQNWENDASWPGFGDDVVFFSTTSQFRRNPWIPGLGYGCNSLTFQDCGGTWKLMGNKFDVVSGSVTCEGGSELEIHNTIVPDGSTWNINTPSLVFRYIRAGGGTVTLNGTAHAYTGYSGNVVGNLIVNTPGLTIDESGDVGIDNVTLAAPNSYLSFGSDVNGYTYSNVILDPSGAGNRSLTSAGFPYHQGNVTGSLAAGGELQISCTSSGFQFYGNLSMDAPGGVAITGGKIYFLGHNTYDDPTYIRAGTLDVSGSAGELGTGYGPVFVEAAGRLSGTGTVDPAAGNDVTVRGTIAPRQTFTVGSPGSENDVVFENGGTLESWLRGNTADMLRIRGDLVIGDTTTLRIVRDQVLTDQYTLIEYTGQRVGAFDNIIGLGDLFLVYDDINRRVILAPELPLLPGDANGDGCVDDLDLTSLAVHWQESTSLWEHGDFNGDGIVDDLDLTALAVNWQQGCGGGSFADTLATSRIVPGPATLSLLAIGGLSLIRRRRT